MARYTYSLADHAAYRHCGGSQCRRTNQALVWVKLATPLLSVVSCRFNSAGMDSVCMLALDLSQHVLRNQRDSLIYIAACRGAPMGRAHS